jgi:hypothetical protein
MTLDKIEWSQGCCGESSRYAEVELQNGHWLQIWMHRDGSYAVWEYDAQKRPVDQQRRAVTEHQLVALLA